MATIKIDNLQPLGMDLFTDNESFMHELNTDELGITGGGSTIITWTAASSVGCAVGIAIVSTGFAIYHAIQ